MRLFATAIATAALLPLLAIVLPPAHTYALAVCNCNSESSTSILDDCDPHFFATSRNDDGSFVHSLEKRRGGGGRGGGGRAGRSGGGRASSGGGSGSRTSSTSNAGGRTSKGSGTPYYGGNSYRGGAAVPFKAGSASPGGLRPSLMALAAAATLLPGAWLLGAYLYHTSDAHTFHSSSPSTSGDGPRNGTETLPVLCVCSEHSVCGCDSSANDTYYDALYDTARRTPADADSYAAIIANVNGTRTLVINGTLANGTTAPGGNDATSSASSGIFGSSAVPFAHKWGALVVVAVVVALLSS